VKGGEEGKEGYDDDGGNGGGGDNNEKGRNVQ
jgi:hypothetical protein